jgi:NDP-4-keto-2,6-dideoxyhexose 3-C-methyltransferase
VSHRAIAACRICGGTNLATVLDLGEQALTGVFPDAKSPDVEVAPLDLVKCVGGCGLVQLRHTCEPSMMYGANYGYRSGLNRSMVEHLRAKVAKLATLASLAKGDVVLDIGSNDGTTLSSYPADAKLFGIDPTAAKFLEHYPPHVKVVPDFFSSARFFEASGGARAKIITSIAMFYDLERPMDFMQQVFDSLADDGIWHFEQSYLPMMLDAVSYDTICHEHLEYYALAQIQWMAERVGFRIVDVELNDINGGSFAVTAKKGRDVSASPRVAELAAQEKKRELDALAPYERFAADVARHRDELRALLGRLRDEGKRVFGLGASTKGNVLLQYCGIGVRDLACIAEVNPDKFGHVTPGTHIPIVSEAEALGRSPDYFMVLPWHFRSAMLRAHASFIERGGKMIFPLPRLEIVTA